jgi:subtilisin
MPAAASTLDLPWDDALDSVPEWVETELGSALGDGITVAIVDSGRDDSYVDGRILPGCTIRDSNAGNATVTWGDESDTLGHGTACASVVLAVAPRARIIPMRVFEDRLETSVTRLSRAILLAAEMGADVINLSLGTVQRHQARDLYESCASATRLGAVIVSAAQSQSVCFPAAFDNVIGVVSAPVRSRFDFWYLPSGRYELFACGRAQPVRWRHNIVVRRAGASMAAANVSGLVARCRQHIRNADTQHVRSMLARGAMPRPWHFASATYKR